MQRAYPLTILVFGTRTGSSVVRGSIRTVSTRTVTSIGTITGSIFRTVHPQPRFHEQADVVGDLVRIWGHRTPPRGARVKREGRGGFSPVAHPHVVRGDGPNTALVRSRGINNSALFFGSDAFFFFCSKTTTALCVSAPQNPLRGARMETRDVALFRSIKIFVISFFSTTESVFQVRGQRVERLRNRFQNENLPFRRNRRREQREQTDVSPDVDYR